MNAPLEQHFVDFVVVECCIQLKLDMIWKNYKSIFLQNQVEEPRLQKKLGKQNFHEDMKKSYEFLTNTNQDTS